MRNFMSLHTQEIFSIFHPTGILEKLEGEAIINRIAPVEECQPGDLVFIDKKEYLDYIAKGKPSAVVCSKEFWDKLKEINIPALFLSPNVGLAHALLKQKYGDRNWYDTSEWGQIHPSAVVHESVKIPSSCIIGPGVVIGRNCKLGEKVIIQANSVLEENVTIGDETKIMPLVFIGKDTEIGKRVYIHSGTCIGNEGFGFAPDDKKVYHRIPQTGKVIIEDDVRIGSNCCIDRAAYSETRIKKGTKMDNMIHIAHNVQVGENCIFVAQTGIAGSTKIGNRVILSGQTGVLDHLNVADDGIFLVRAGITQDVDKPGIYAGLPLMPFPDYMKYSAVARKLVELRADIKKLEKAIQEKK